MSSVRAPLDLDDGRSFRHACAVRRLGWTDLQRHFAPGTISRLMHGRLVSGETRERAIALLRATPIDPDLVLSVDELMGVV